MNRKYLFFILAACSIAISCTSLPRLAKLSPEYYEDENIKISYLIGVSVYNIIIENKSEFEMYFDVSRASIISIDGESRNIGIKSMDSHIPPKSKVIFYGSQDSIYSTDLYSPFKNKKYDYSGYGDQIDKEYVLNSAIGNSIRLFLPVIINNTEKIFDITLNIEGIQEFNR